MHYLRKYLLPLILAGLLSGCGEKETPSTVTEKKATGESSMAEKEDLKGAISMEMPKQMRHCTPCHPVKEGVKHKIGPNLYGILGRRVGAADDYKYSKEYKEGNWLWTRENLDLLINKKYGTLEEAVRKLTGNPAARTKMKFYGADDEDAQIILDYLETLK